MDKKTQIAIVLCVVIWVVWARLFQPSIKERQTHAAANVTEKQPSQQEKPDQEKKVTKQSEPIVRETERLVSLHNAKMEVVVSNHGAGLMHLNLFDYKERDSKKVFDKLGYKDLVSTHVEAVRPLTIHFNQENTSFHLSPIQDWEVVQESAQHVELRLENQEDTSVPVLTKRFSIVDEYEIDLDVKIENRSQENLQEQISLDLYAKNKPAVRTGCAGARSVLTSPLCMMDDGVFPSSGACGSTRAKMKPGTLKKFTQRVRWTGINEQYFLMAAIPLDKAAPVCYLASGYNNILTSDLMYPQISIGPGEQKTHRFRIFAGPKQMSLLGKVNTGEENQSVKLSASVNYGWFSFLSYPMLWLLKKFFSIVGNYGIAIIMLTIMIKLLLLPLTHKSQKSMGDMAKIKPLMQELKERYGDDKQKINREMMNLYKNHKINPAGGCLPMILQTPIWISLYRMLYSSVELYQATFIPGWLTDLSYRDPTFILPIVLGITMFLQQKTSARADTKQAKAMVYIMPAFFTFIMLYLPSGLVLYILTNSLLSICYQMIYKRMREKG